ncbi:MULTISPECIES: GNAT family N-acetyltransferase [unclassified Streptomyces]|uniref:GNAT family N-acetyltransferase n=1 Tax=Streptomyces evansiae TaxID=3075535 RepID=A0ABU2RDL3_9ACTN|nr:MULTISPECIES: GNAT family N-acetyltransferase [unclassified Streptomyces]MDT0413385.1 GNAT family N-acetyltransferase [Streptomyces sp. DSM 41979]MYQ60949.1 GNAT family N-acetyltransferase [Streptomyces sp. SID4926]MYR28216.1 GNAT family N-acetyltransferase [Streptomyces sp. SID4945]SCD46906.1 phosphinothricin acetyltransferase [Streptomyces sp. TverLS-915]SCD97199.1 phosphinothricin acetyltransferase [Streptomyces sp. DfronAA-171]
MPESTEKVQVRAGREGDLPQLTEIYNHYVTETPITFDTVPFTADQRMDWFRAHPTGGPHRLLVAHAPGRPAGADVLGYATSGAFRSKPAYATSVEVSVYCRPGEGGHGLGTRLYTALFASLAGEDVHRAYAGIALPNPASLALHDRFGFRHLGTYAEVGRKFGRYWDVAWYEKDLAP